MKASSPLFSSSSFSSSCLRLPVLLLLFMWLLLLLAFMQRSDGAFDAASASASARRPAWGAAAAAAVSAWVDWRNLTSLVQTLLQRVANLRSGRGDLLGSERVREIAQALGNSVTWWTRAASVGWDYFIHYYFRESLTRPLDLSRAMHHLRDLLSVFGELAQLRSDTDRLHWISTNYMRVLRNAKALLNELLLEFDSSGALRDCLLAIQREIADGSLIRDSLQLGASDLLGLVKTAIDLLQNLVTQTARNSRSEL
ncbi:hypothetical protein O6H91_23G037400 [Diphasiastrum complanatum]|uniref:Uncharacterized protein n=2 Tax=Diphasiastrum complanatum TaxID=34168 RepID=A0ACC2A9Q7_DIPCM|nr:hypothetical protein O6H91_23G037100 [Diphasiastrum complanatum]KAJ7514290.1 hypothetical protein O6H91_23G037400 [Diphasiastrum complanatum]